MMSEEQVRALRDQVFEKSCTDFGWEAVKSHWMTPDNVRWLLEKSKRRLRDYATHT